MITGRGLADRMLDTRPLRTSAPFRRLWLGTTAAAVGRQVALVAVLLQVWQLTGSPAWVGAIGLAHAIPTIGGSLLGGALADIVDRRRLAMVATAVGIAGSLLLAAQAMAGTGTPPLVLGLVAVQAAGGALGAPARRAFVPRLLPRHQVAAGIALSHLSFQAAMLVGPALGGLAAAGAGVAACYLVHAGTSVAALYGVARLPPVPPTPDPSSPTISTRLGARVGARMRVGMGVRLGAVFAGWGLIARRPVLRGSFLTDLAATLLAMPIAVFPMVNQERFGGDPRTLGLFLSAVAVGGVTAGLASGALTRARRPGRIMLAAATAWGASLAGFGLAAPLWLALACLALAGAADTISVISRGAIVQLATPDSHRGRVSAAENVVGAAGPDLGNVRAGLVADLTSSAVALASGGLLCVLAVAAVAATNRPLRRFSPDPAAPVPAGDRLG